MKTIHALTRRMPHRNRSLATACACLATWLLASPAVAQSQPPLLENDFRRELNRVESAAEPERLPAARGLLGRGWMSSQQVKAVAVSLPNDDARLQFALAAYPRTVDPENFYEVYDAFRAFSKVFRLHDGISGVNGGAIPLPPPAVPLLTESEFKDMLRTLKNEDFDDKRLTLARQIVTSARGRLQSNQVREMLKLFSFDDRRLELAKAAYGSVTDPWAYHVVNEAFDFATNREALARYIQERTMPKAP